MWWGNFQLLAYFAGEAVLYLLTFGTRKPEWNIDDVPYRTRTHVSVFVGTIVLIPLIIIAYIIFIGLIS